MWVLVRMAVRNLFAHKAKSLIVGSIIAFGVMILLAGISFMDTAALGLRKSFIENFTGDVIITGNAGAPVSLFGVQSMGGTEATPLLPRYGEVLAHVRSQPGVKAVTPQVTGASQINIEGNDSANVDSLVFMFGIDPDSYRPMFDNLDLRSGRYLQPGEQGILLSSSQVASLDKELKANITVGDTVIVQNFGTAIRAVTVRGIFDYKRSNSALCMISYIDAASLRALEGEPADAWHFLIVSLADPRDTSRFIAEANQWFAANGIAAQAAGWQRAAGPFAVIPGLIRILLIVAILIVSVVAIIIIMNTLVASVIARTGEIGTMRALGAKKGFVWIMFLIETLTISIVFGLIGTLIGAVVITALGAAGIPATNTILQLLVGGPILRPVVTGSALGASVLVFFMIGVIAHLYPVAVALRIPPIRAIRAGESE
jgi:ABC-type lipoprotein release transport system permease subunit